MTVFLNVLIFSSIAGTATVVGITMVLAAGHILPAALELNSLAPIWFVAGFVVFFAAEHIITIHACGRKECGDESQGLIAVAGIGLHSLFDGVAIGLGRLTAH